MDACEVMVAADEACAAQADEILERYRHDKEDLEARLDRPDPICDFCGKANGPVEKTASFGSLCADCLADVRGNA